MIQHEVVVLPFPTIMKELDAAVAAFVAQYQVAVRIEICGNVTLSGEQYCYIPAWIVPGQSY